MITRSKNQQWSILLAMFTLGAALVGCGVHLAGNNSSNGSAAASGAAPSAANNIASPAAAGTNAPTLVFRRAVNARWFAGNDKFWYRNELDGQKREFVVVDTAAGTRAPAFDHQRIAQALSKETGKTIKADALPFTTIKIADDGKWVQFMPMTTNVVWRCDLASYQLTKPDGETMVNEPANEGGGGRGGRRGGGGGGADRGNRSNNSPDGKWEAIVKDYNLLLRNRESREEFALTTDGNATNTYARDVERERAVGMAFNTAAPVTPEPEVFWSPDSKHVVAIRTRAGDTRTVYYVESSPTNQFQPALRSYPYLKPGDTVPFEIPHLFDVEAKKEIPVSDALFPNQYALDQIRWMPDSSRFMFRYNERGHQALRVLGVDASSGEVKPIIDETSKTFIDYSGKFYSEYLQEAGEIIWMSERDGWNHLYLYDVKTGKVKNQITKGEWVVNRVERVDRDTRQIWFTAAGIRSGQDPYYVHYCRANLDGTGLTILTEGNGTHAIAWSPDRRFFVDTWSRADMPPVNELRRGSDGGLVCKLEQADASALLASGVAFPEPFVTKARDGVTDIYGVIVRPKNFDPKKKYPILENVYAGPQGFFTPKAFGAADRFQALADRGFVLVQSDGLGTSGRSKKFHDVCWKNIVDAGFPDRIKWIKTAAAKYPYMDINRVGIYGTSAGGQNALAGILTHPDFYKAAVADCGCHDNRMDKIWWNEQWMGWPVGKEYEQSANVSYVQNLRGKLFLMVGEADQNVDPASTMQVVNALIKANKDFDLLVMPGVGHGAARTPYGSRRLAEFFVKHLQGIEPVSQVQNITSPSQ